jgi:hypothetical protein
MIAQFNFRMNAQHVHAHPLFDGTGCIAASPFGLRR